MLIRLRKMMTNQKGFTLVELMVVIAILGVLAAIAVPKFASSTNAAKDAALKADLRTVDSALMQYYAAHNDYPSADTAAAKTALVGTYLAAWPKDTAGTDLSYSHTAATTIYTLSGVATVSATAKVSPGSTGYVIW